MENDIIAVGGNNLHKLNFIKALNKAGFLPEWEDIDSIIEEDDTIVAMNNKRFFLSDRKANLMLPADWDEAIEAFRNAPPPQALDKIF